MICQSCGTSLATGALFCGGCGAKVVPMSSVGATGSGPRADYPAPTAGQRKRLIIQLALAVGIVAAVIGGVLFYQEMRDDYGADMNFDGTITPAEISDYTENRWQWNDGIWTFQPLTFVGTNDLRYLPEQLNFTQAEPAGMMFFSLNNQLTLGETSILPYRIDQCRVTDYHIREAHPYSWSLSGMPGEPGTELDVRLDCSAMVGGTARTGSWFSDVTLRILHTDQCLKGSIYFAEGEYGFNNSRALSGDFIGYSDESCWTQSDFSAARVYYHQESEELFGLDYFILNRELNLDFEREQSVQDRRDADAAAGASR